MSDTGDWLVNGREDASPAVATGAILEAEEAIAIAKAARPLDIAGADESLVSVQTMFSTDDPVSGRLLRCDSETIILRRESARAGALNIHFPRIGQDIIFDQIIYS